MTTDPTLDAIGAVRVQVADLRTELTTRLDTMVTRREHDAEVRRLDAEATRTREALARHETNAGRHRTEIEDSIDTRVGELLAVIEDDRRDRARQATRDAEQRHADRRWLLGMVVSAGGLAVALGQLFTRWL